MDASNLPPAGELGLPEDLAPRWRNSWSAPSRPTTRVCAARCTRPAEPERVRLPKDARPAVVARIRKNYALDRTRYFVRWPPAPALRWCNLAHVGADGAATSIRSRNPRPAPPPRPSARAAQVSPRLMRHSFAETSHQEQARQELAASLRLDSSASPPTARRRRVGEGRPRHAACCRKPNRSARPCATGQPLRQCGQAIRRMRVTFAWNNLAIAELRDLNRHRTGHRYTPLSRPASTCRPRCRLRPMLRCSATSSP